MAMLVLRTHAYAEGMHEGEPTAMLVSLDEGAPIATPAPLDEGESVAILVHPHSCLR